MLIFPSPIWVQFWNPSLAWRVKINRKDFREFFNAKWSNGNSETMEETMSVFSICLIDVPQNPLVCLI
jgi:hypothetical protein